MKLQGKAERVCAVMLAIGSAHAGERLTQEQLMDRLKTDPAFRAKFNGPMPAKVVFPDALTASVASDFESAGKVDR